MDPETIWTAIIGQESGGALNNPGQIQPSTFAQYAQPGENINNPTDNIAVSKRIINDYYKRYNGDVGRIATAYFSGPGNVSQSGPIPFQYNKNDGRKTTASYVSDIYQRVNAMNQPDTSNFDPNAAFSKYESATQQPEQTFNPDAAFSKWETSPAAAAPQPVSGNYRTVAGSLIPIPASTPQEIAERNASVAATKAAGTPNWLLENYHPLAAITQTVSGGESQIGQGLKDIAQGNVATGVGNVGLGAINTVGGPLIGPYNETFRMLGQAIGNPQAADVASLVVPGEGATSKIAAALPANRAANTLVNLIGKENIPDVLRKLQSNPNLSLMDVSEPVKTVAAGLANSPETPTAQNIMRQAYEARTGARQDLVQQAVDKTLGPPMNVKDVTDQLSNNLKTVGDKLIQPALEGAQPIGVAPILQRLDSVIGSPSITEATQKELVRVRKQIAANGEDSFVDPNTLHNIQWPLRAQAQNLAKSASGAERNMSGPLMNVRNDIVDAIDVASGGKYKPALSQYRDASLVPEAMEKGFNILKTGGMEDFPEHWQAWAANASPQEIMAARVGAVSAIRRQIEGMQSGARRGEAVLRPTFVQERFNTIFHPAQTQALSSLLNDASSMAETNSLLYKNSKTAQVTAGQQVLQPRQVGAPAGAAGGIGAGLLGSLLMAGGQELPGLVGLGIGGMKTAHAGLQYLGNISDKATASNFAKLASASEGPSRNQLLRILSAANSRSSNNRITSLVPSLARLAAP